MTFELYENMENVKDSLQFDSGTQIARYKDDDYTAQIEVNGEVRITFENEVYRKPSEFPQELKNIIATGKVFDDERVFVGNNNWFDIAVFYKGSYVDYSNDVVDVEGMTASEIQDLLKCAVDLVKEYGIDGQKSGQNKEKTQKDESR